MNHDRPWHEPAFSPDSLLFRIGHRHRGFFKPAGDHRPTHGRADEIHNLSCRKSKIGINCFVYVCFILRFLCFLRKPPYLWSIWKRCRCRGTGVSILRVDSAQPGDFVRVGGTACGGGMSNHFNEADLRSRLQNSERSTFSWCLWCLWFLFPTFEASLPSSPGSPLLSSFAAEMPWELRPSETNFPIGQNWLKAWLLSID